MEVDISTLIANYAMQFVSGTPVVVFIATGLSMFLPTKLKTKKKGLHITAANSVLKALNIVAGNVLKNKNKDDK